LAKSHSHHYPGLLEQKRFRSRSGLQKISNVSGAKKLKRFPSNVSGAEADFKKFIYYSPTSLTLKSNLLNVGKVLLLAKQA